MQHVCPNPGCGAVYTVTSDLQGRRFKCKKCSVTLVVEADSLFLADPVEAAYLEPNPPPPDLRPGQEHNLSVPLPPPPPALGLNSSRNPHSPQGVSDQIRADLYTWLFGAGAFLIIVCLFFPLIDQEKIRRRDAQYRERDRSEKYMDEDLALRKKKEKDKEKLKKLDTEEEERKKARERWDEEKGEMSYRKDSAGFDADKSRYWYFWGTMLGFLLLSVAALGYLRPGQPLTRRIVASIILCGEVLLVFFKIVIARMAG